MAEQKFQIGQQVVLPSGERAKVEEATNWWQVYAHLLAHERQNFKDEYEYHVSFPGQGLGGRLNYKEYELKPYGK